MEEIIDDLNKKLNQFERDTGIWPPGRDMPAALCGADDDLHTVRYKAYVYWCKTETLLAENKRLREALEEHISLLADIGHDGDLPEGCNMCQAVLSLKQALNPKNKEPKGC